MKFATKAATRAKRLRRKFRRRFLTGCIIVAVTLIGMSIPIVNSLHNNLRVHSEGTPTTTIDGPPGDMGKVLSFQIGNSSTAKATTPDKPSASTPATTVTTSHTTSVTRTAPGTPATVEPLMLSPASITVYKNTSGAQGVRSGGLATGVTARAAGADQLIEEPYVNNSSGLTVSSPEGTFALYWQLYFSAPSAAPGQYSVTISASSANGTIYSGTLTVTVTSLPTFSLSSTADIEATVQRGSTDTADFTDLAYSASQTAPTPSVTATTLSGNTSITCSGGLSFTDTDLTCSDPNISTLGDGTVPMEFTFENQYQLVTIAGSLITMN